MSKLCSAPTCSNEISIDSPYYTCCDPSQKYCKECSLTAICSKCHRVEKKQQILRICSKCDGKVNLYKCGCRTVCQACNLQRDSQETVQCPLCRTLFKPINDTMTSSAKTAIKRPVNSVVPPASAPKTFEDCQQCMGRRDATELYYNVCGHAYCRQCLVQKRIKTQCRRCIFPTPLVGVEQFLNSLKVCFMCEKPKDVTDYGPDKNLCLDCFHTAFNEDLPPMAADPIVNGSTHKQSKFQEPKPFKVQGKEGKGPAPTTSPITVLETAPSPAKGVNLQPVPLNGTASAQPNNNFLSPNMVPEPMRGSMKTPEKRLAPPSVGTPSQGSAQKQNSPAASTGGRDLSKSNASMVDPSIPVACTSCRILYLPRLLLTTSCKSKHRMCRSCTLRFRGKDCDVCRVAQQQHLDKYFCYKELTGEQKAVENQRLSQSGEALCFGCNIILLRSRTIVEKSRSYCKPCLLRLK